SIDDCNLPYIHSARLCGRPWFIIGRRETREVPSAFVALEPDDRARQRHPIDGEIAADELPDVVLRFNGSDLDYRTTVLLDRNVLKRDVFEQGSGDPTKLELPLNKGRRARRDL